MKTNTAEVIHMLIEEGPEMRYEQNKVANSPIYLAVEGGDVEITKLLLEREVVADRIQGMSPAHAMVIHQRMDMLSMITEKTDFFRSKVAKACNLLHLGAYENYKDAVSIMLDHFPESAAQYDGAGYLPAHIASKMGNVDVLMRLLEACANLTELLNKKCQNVLYISTRYGCSLIVLFISRNPRLQKHLNQKDEDGNTPLRLAAMQWWAISLIWMVTRNELDVKLVHHDCLTACDAAEKRIKSKGLFGCMQMHAS